MESPNYDFLFALRTVHHKKAGDARTYYLAADSQAEMNIWVDNLCTVLGLKESEQGTPASHQITIDLNATMKFNALKRT